MIAAQPSLRVSRYADVRAQSMALAAPLSETDAQVQSMPDASPTKWHLAHVTWFFETFVLERFERNFRPHHPSFRVLFNSYYNGIGDQHPRPQRGLITRPGLADVLAYRAAVDERMTTLLAAPHDPAIDAIVELGLQHEQQHQELLLTDALHLLSCNPLAPVYRPRWPLAAVDPVALDWVAYAGGLVEIGHDGSGFAFDNEAPRHAQYLRPYALANRLTTHGEWAEFIADGGYREPRWWLSAGWDWVRAQRIEAPLYWRRLDERWHCFTLHGLVPIDEHTPITHISYFEADAFARWSAAQSPRDAPHRLPTEAEWEHAAQMAGPAAIASGNFVDSRALHPVPVAARQPGAAMQLFGDVWQWTSSSYAPYPGFRAWDGAVGEYNAKFMVNQYVLRGGSCATPRDHIRASYRNFFPTDARWQFNGLRLARDVD
ncbi:MAG: ergothioneine biosynthesis protein EgtB [Burkholderiales bacterium]|nr:ergothioneine biosynthesis protein EgtB [Burkholderiales bacterium]